MKLLRLYEYQIIIILTLGLHFFALWFIFNYTTTYPLAIDEWLYLVPRNTQFLDGTLSFTEAISTSSMVADAPSGPFFYNWLFILPNVAFLNWNLQLDSVLNYVLITINILLILNLLLRHQPQLRTSLLFPVTALMLAVQQRWNLLVSSHLALHMQILFSLASFVVLTAPKRTLKHVLVAALIAFMGTFASIIGLLTWIIVLPALWFLSYHDWKAYVIWVVGLVVAVLVLSSLPGASLSSGHYTTEVSGDTSLVKDIMGYVMFTLAYLGGVFGSGETSNIAVAFFLGGLSLITFLVNFLHLWRKRIYRDFVVICTMLSAYGFMFGGMAAVGRLHQFGVRWGMTHHYISFSVLFWVGVSGLLALVIWRAISQPGAVRPPLLICNALVIAIATFYYFVGAYDTVRVAENHRQFVVDTETCIVETAYGLRPNSNGCEVVGGLALTEWINDLYEHKLTGFAE